MKTRPRADEYCLSAPVVYAKKLYTILRSLNVLDITKKFVVHNAKVFFPLRSIEIPERILNKYSCKIIQAPFSFPRKQRQISLRTLRDKTKLDIPQSITLVNDIILISKFEIPTNQLEEIGRILLDAFSVRAVFIKERETSGEYRIPSWKLIAGWGKPETIHIEDSCWYYVNFERAFFNPRMQGERSRVYINAQKGENILDMFAGIGGFSIRLAKKARKITSIDINPHAIELLELNAKMNNVDKIINPINCDATKIVPKLNETFDRIIMDFPAGSLKFLNCALAAARQNTIINLYIFWQAKNKEEALKEVIQIVERELQDINYEITYKKVRREVGKRKFLIALDVAVK